MNYNTFSLSFFDRVSINWRVKDDSPPSSNEGNPIAIGIAVLAAIGALKLASYLYENSSKRIDSPQKIPSVVGGENIEEDRGSTSFTIISSKMSQRSTDSSHAHSPQAVLPTSRNPSQPSLNAIELPDSDQGNTSANLTDVDSIPSQQSTAASSSHKFDILSPPSEPSHPKEHSNRSNPSLFSWDSLKNFWNPQDKREKEEQSTVTYDTCSSSMYSDIRSIPEVRAEMHSSDTKSCSSQGDS